MRALASSLVGVPLRHLPEGVEAHATKSAPSNATCPKTWRCGKRPCAIALYTAERDTPLS